MNLGVIIIIVNHLIELAISSRAGLNTYLYLNTKNWCICIEKKN